MEMGLILFRTNTFGIGIKHLQEEMRFLFLKDLFEMRWYHGKT